MNTSELRSAGRRPGVLIAGHCSRRAKGLSPGCMKPGRSGAKSEIRNPKEIRNSKSERRTIGKGRQPPWSGKGSHLARRSRMRRGSQRHSLFAVSRRPPQCFPTQSAYAAKIFPAGWSAGLLPAWRGGSFQAGCKPALHFGCGFAALCLCVQRNHPPPTRRFRISSFGFPSDFGLRISDLASYQASLIQPWVCRPLTDTLHP